MDLYKERTVTFEEESVADLVRDLRDEAMIMVQQQIELAKTETSEKVSKYARNTGYLFAGSLVLYAGLLLLFAGITALGYLGLIALGTSAATALWLSPVIIGLIVGAIGTVLVFKAISAFKTTPVLPEKTFHSLKEDKKWLTRKGK